VKTSLQQELYKKFRLIREKVVYWKAITFEFIRKCHFSKFFNLTIRYFSKTITVKTSIKKTYFSLNLENISLNNNNGELNNFDQFSIWISCFGKSWSILNLWMPGMGFFRFKQNCVSNDLDFPKAQIWNRFRYYQECKFNYWEFSVNFWIVIQKGNFHFCTFLKNQCLCIAFSLILKHVIIVSSR